MSFWIIQYVFHVSVTTSGHFGLRFGTPGPGTYGDCGSPVSKAAPRWGFGSSHRGVHAHGLGPSWRSHRTWHCEMVCPQLGLTCWYCKASRIWPDNLKLPLGSRRSFWWAEPLAARFTGPLCCISKLGRSNTCPGSLTSTFCTTWIDVFRLQFATSVSDPHGQIYSTAVVFPKKKNGINMDEHPKTGLVVLLTYHLFSILFGIRSESWTGSIRPTSGGPAPMVELGQSPQKNRFKIFKLSWMDQFCSNLCNKILKARKMATKNSEITWHQTFWDWGARVGGRNLMIWLVGLDICQPLLPLDQQWSGFRSILGIAYSPQYHLAMMTKIWSCRPLTVSLYP